MAVDFTSAVNAYNQASRQIKTGLQGDAVKIGPDAATKQDDTFSGMVKESLQDAVTIGKKGEEMSIRQIRGEADLQEVVMAVANAEETLNTVVAVRDKVLEAYQSIIKMPI